MTRDELVRILGGSGMERAVADRIVLEFDRLHAEIEWARLEGERKGTVDTIKALTREGGALP